MYSCPQSVIDLLMSRSRQFRAQLLYNNSPLDISFRSARIQGGSNLESDFMIGGVVSQTLTATITKPNINIEDKELKLQIGVRLGDTSNDYYDIPMGVFTVIKPETNESEITFTAYDRMIKLDKLYSSSTVRTTAFSLLNRISEITGVPISTVGLSSVSMLAPAGVTCRELLSLIAEQYGGFAVCDRTGTIVIKTYGSSVLTLEPSHYWDTFKHNDFTFALDAIVCTVGTDENGEPIQYSAGSGPRRLIFSNSTMSQSDVNRVWSILQNFEYMPGSLKLLGDPRLDPWDVVTVVDKNNVTFNVPVMQISQEFDGGLSTTITAVGKSEEESSINYQGPNTRMAERYAAQLAVVDHALVNKLDVNTANATFATILNLNATNAHVQDLYTELLTADNAIVNRLTAIDADIDNLEATSLTANSAEITNLNAQYANIASLLSGNAGVGSLQTIVLNADNASISTALIKNILANNITVNDLLADDIITNRQRITSEDGSFLIDGSTQTIKDENGNVRIQIGRDANNNFTIAIFDATGNGLLFDASGITENAIANGLIKDAKIANDANIQGSKLDIDSVFTAMNGSNKVLYANRIYFDQDQQTLTQAYSQLTSSITTVSNAAATASANAQRAIDALSGITSLDNLTAILSNDSHVVHTLNDGTGGDYTNAVTTIEVYKGDMNVSASSTITATPSPGLTGTWDSTTRTYHVTQLSGFDGYVDFTISYESVIISKRFSISKSPDGNTGVSYNLLTSVSIIKRSLDGTFDPSSVLLSALYSDGAGLATYHGKYKIETSVDGDTWTVVYESTTTEEAVSYTPTGDINFIRVTLLDSNDTTLDIESITIVTNAEELAEELDVVQESVQSISTRVGTVETGINGLVVDLADTQTELHGLSDSVLIFQAPYTRVGNNVVFTAKVYRAGEDVTTEFPERWFTWIKRTEKGDTYLGYGYTQTVSTLTMDFGGAILARFDTFETVALRLPDTKFLRFPDDKLLAMYISA